MKKFFSLLTLLGSLSCAQSPAPPELTPSHLDNPKAVTLINKLKHEQGFDEATLNAYFSRVATDVDVLNKISKPAEKSKEWFEYKKIFDDEDRRDRGVEFFNKNKAVLEKAEELYGVDKYIITAIIGVETRYGKIMGKTPVFQSLATLCFDYPPRAEFFCSELVHFLQLQKREKLDIYRTQGSYAGAMGMGQFMPSSYLNDAVDGDGDGKIDLFNSDRDVIYSVANYLKNRGWKKDSEYFYAQQLPDDGQLKAFGSAIKPYQIIREINRNPKTYALELRTWLDKHPQEKVGTLNLVGDKGKEYWLVSHNFHVITRYNTSPMYAMAVVNLAQAIRNLAR